VVATDGETVELDRLGLGPGRSVLYFYPLTGRPGVDLPDGWDAIPGALELPAFTAGGQRLHSRPILVVDDGRVEHVFYPIFQPNRHAQQVLAWLRADPPRLVRACEG
jgi:peroxiredoxin